MVHQYKNNGYNIVLDVCSGSVHVVDDLVYDIIEGYPDSSREELTEKLSEDGKYTKTEVDEAISDVEKLIEAGQLFTEDTYHDLVIDFKNRKTVVKALCLNVTHDCNLACRYCFAGQGEYNGDKALMSYEVGKRALDFLVENSGNRRNLEVDFFGGEPLMNWDVVKRLVAYGRSIEKEHDKNFRFTLTTNGVLLTDEVLEFANKELKNVVLSIDGRKEVNDHMRPTSNGKGSYDVIMPKFKRFAEGRKGEYFVRGTYTHENLDFSKDVECLIDEGFTEISMEPVVAPAETSYSIKEEDVDKLCEEYDRLAKMIIEQARSGHPVDFFHFQIDLEGGPCVYKRLAGCGAGTEYLAVTPWGDLYPCHQFVGNEAFKIGDIYNGIDREDIVGQFKLCNVYAKEKCKDCFARFFCSGGCAANAHEFHGNLTEPYEIGCKLERKRVECAIMIKAALSELGLYNPVRDEACEECDEECSSAD